MATSGTYSFNLDLSDILEEAYERAGLELRSGYDYRTARRSLDLMFLEWQNKGLNLWTVQEGSQTSDLTMSRISISQYSHLTNKLTQGRPIQYWIEKDPDAIALNVWPVPDDAETYKVNYYYIQRVEDTGSPASNNVDIPARFLPCMAAGLAYYISVKRPEASDRAPLLKQIYDEQWDLAADADRDKSSFFMVPGGYSRV